MSEERDPSFEALLEFLKRSRGFDFTGYKRPSLERRFRRRMETVGCGSFGDYLDYLEVHPEEYEQLFNTLLINVTEFFRDPPAWDELRRAALPEILDAKRPEEPIRVWSAGCASGHEAYTIAMILAEELGHDAFRERVKIYATDIDEEALEIARHAIYSPKELESVPEELRSTYFERVDQRVAFRKDLRRSVIFGRNNLIADAPISRLDVLLCRNTLMYLNAETQARILRHFHFALGMPGILMLGKSEMMISHRELFSTIDLRARIFRKLPRPTMQSRLAGLGAAEHSELPLTDDDRGTRDAALELGPHAQLIVSRSGVLTFANLAARALFKVGPSDLGKPFGDLELARRPANLREVLAQALRDRRRATVGEVRFTPERGEERRLEIDITPLLANGNTVLGVSVTFEDVTRLSTLQSELESNRRDLELAYEELQSTIDELETTNEELQSANEELQTTNEELQSTNEELETMNEELQSTNEELETINDELRERTTELNQVNEFLETILTSLSIGVAVLDPQQRVQVWNHRAEDLWGTRRDEAVEQHFLSLDIGLPTEAIAPALRAVLTGGAGREQVEVEAVNRRGRSIVCVATVMPLPASSGDGAVVRGAIVLMEDRPSSDGAGPE
jgi:two-component system, chemotaxis family, CheB/CheR fusion protein